MSLPADILTAATADFEGAARAVWDHQIAHNPVMRRFCTLLGTGAPTFMPIAFFRDMEMKTGTDWEPEAVFESSGTTGQRRSRHFVRALTLYHEALLRGFRHFYGPGEFAVLALLPGYIERGNASLVHMVKTWMDSFGLPGSGFYLEDHAALHRALRDTEKAGRRILLIGVSHALLDLAERFGVKLPEDAIVMETGGMKGKRREMVRAELHATLRDAFGVPRIHSEYGMTELLSQAYLQGGQRVRCPPWMRVTITDPYIPGRSLPHGQAGRINITDLANVHSCAFIRTDDVGRARGDGSFEVLGRLDHAELRGCNLLYA